MKTLILTISVVLFLTTSILAQIANAKTETVKVYGNCGICETTIEKAGNKRKLYKTDWDKDTKTASITYNTKKTDLDAVLKSIALSGHDNVKYLAPDEAYHKLPGCCKYNREKKVVVKTLPKQNTDKMALMQDNTSHTQNNMANEKQQISQLKVAFDNYFELKDALVKTDGATASVKAEALFTALDAVEMGKLKMDEHNVWMKVEKKLKADAQQIKEAKEINVKREHFISLSTTMHELIKVSKPAETVYYQFCPMANDGKGANWLSKEKTIKNPYYGSQMLSCGKTIETIKPQTEFKP